MFDVVVRAPLKGAAAGDGLLPLRDLDQIRAFLSGSGPSAFFDLPWMPIYLAVCFLFHPLIGITALCGAGFLAGVTWLTDRTTRTCAQPATGHGSRRNGLAEGRRNAEALGITLCSHRDLKIVLHGFNAAYNGRRQRVLDGLSPEMALRQRLEADPALVNPAHSPPIQSTLKRALRIAANTKKVSQPDSESRVDRQPRRSSDLPPSTSRHPFQGGNAQKWIQVNQVLRRHLAIQLMPR